MTSANPEKVKILNGPDEAPVTAIHALLIQPALGPPSKIHPIAPTKGGIRNDASTMTLTKPRAGMLVRDTPHASGTAMRPAIAAATAPSSIELISAWT